MDVGVGLGRQDLDAARGGVEGLAGFGEAPGRLVLLGEGEQGFRLAPGGGALEGPGEVLDLGAQRGVARGQAGPAAYDTVQRDLDTLRAILENLRRRAETTA